MKAPAAFEESRTGIWARALREVYDGDIEKR
jgi:hypothetical protein